MARTIAGSAPGRLNRRFLLVAVLLAGLSAALVYAKISATSDSGTSSSAPGDAPVVVAKTLVRQNTQITAEMLTVRSVAADLVIPGAFTNIEDVVGKVTKFPIEANQQVVISGVVDPANPNAATGGLAQVIPTGKRAMSIQASQITNAGGLILPGDFVDIIWICCDNEVIATTILRNVQVAAVAQTVINSGPVAATDDPEEGPVAAEKGAAVPDASTITLLFTPEEAQRIFLAESVGKFRVDLRRPDDTNVADVGVTTLFDILPPAIVAALPDVLKPDGYRPGQQ